MDKTTPTKLDPKTMTPPLNAVLVTDEAGLSKVQDFFSRKSVFGLDVETNIVPHFFHRKIRTIQVGDKDEQYVIDLLRFAVSTEHLQNMQGNYGKDKQTVLGIASVVDTLKPALESNKWLKVGHNLQFDYETLKWCLGLRPWNFYDTLLAEKILYTGAKSFYLKGFWGLDDVVKRYFGLEVSKEYQKSFDLSTPLSQEQIEYAALDTRLALAVKAAQTDPLRKANLMQVSRIEFDAIPAFGDMHLNGLAFDGEKWVALAKLERAKKQDILKRLDSFFIPAVGQKAIPDHNLNSLEAEWRNTDDRVARAAARERFMVSRREIKHAEKAMKTYESEAAINYGSNDQIHAVLLEMGFKKNQLKDTEDKTLKKFATVDDERFNDEYKADPTLSKFSVIDAIRIYRSTDKAIDTYGETWLNHVNPDTGRIHPNHEQLAAETGRTACRNPNLQNIPKESDRRACFIALPGWKFITSDYDGQELRIITEFSGEPSWVAAFNNKWDVHSMNAEELFEEGWKKAAEPNCAYYINRSKCKCKLHKEMREFCKTLSFGLVYGLTYRGLAERTKIAPVKAEEQIRKFFSKRSFLNQWLNKAAKTATTKFEARTLAQRRRLFPRPEWNDAAKFAQERWNRPPSTKEIAQQLKIMYSKIERKGKNTPIQGSGVDMMKLAMGCGFDTSGKPYLWHRLEPEFGAKLVNMVHDELDVEARDEVAESALAVVADCMTRAGQELIKRTPTPADGHIDTKWSKG